MRELTQNELTSIQGGYTYWEPDLYVWDCGPFGCTEVYYPGYWADTGVVGDVLAYGTLALVGVIVIGSFFC